MRSAIFAAQRIRKAPYMLCRVSVRPSVRSRSSV